MTDKFTWRVTTDASGQGDFTVDRAQFGDGYSQEAPRGLNSEVQKWTVAVEGYAPKVQPIIDFIRAHVGVAFNWTPPLGVEGLYKCKRWTANDVGGNYVKLTLEFEQGYAP
jgi:phage-related protein